MEHHQIKNYQPNSQAISTSY